MLNNPGPTPRLGYVAAATVALLLTMAAPCSLRADASNGAYQAPDFDALLFEPDAVSLEGDAKEDVVAALAALVRNFSSVPGIDTDVKEKALALALRLAPLNPDARAAHEMLSGGETSREATAATLHFTDTTKIFATLQPHAERLWRQRLQPDDEVLAPLLMEISLTMLSAEEWDQAEVQSAARMFKNICREVNLDEQWSKTVTVEPIAGDGASQLASRLASLKTAAEMAVKPAAGNKPKPNGAGPGSRPRPKPGTTAEKMGLPSTFSGLPADMAPNPNRPRPAADDGVPVSEVKRLEGDIQFVTTGWRTGEVTLGTVSLRVEPMNQTDTGLFSFFGAAEGMRPEMRLRAADQKARGVRVQQFSTAEEWVRKTYPKWPELQIGLIGMEIEGERPPMGGPRFGQRMGFKGPKGRFGRDLDDDEEERSEPEPPGPRNVSLPVALLLDAAFGDHELDEAVALSGRLSGVAGSVEALLPADEVLEALEEHGDSVSVIALPASAARDELLRDHALLRQASLFVRPQAIAVANIDELRQLAIPAQRPAELKQAMAVFAEVEKLDDLADQLGNQFVREKLERTLELWPAHVSARLLLVAGSSSEDAKLSVKGSVRALDRALEPLLEHFDADEDAVGEIEGVASWFDEVRDQFKVIDGRIADAASGYEVAAERLVIPLRDYLSLRNRSADNANAEQHRRNVEDLLRTLSLSTPPEAQ